VTQLTTHLAATTSALCLPPRVMPRRIVESLNTTPKLLFRSRSRGHQPALRTNSTSTSSRPPSHHSHIHPPASCKARPEQKQDIQRSLLETRPAVTHRCTASLSPGTNLRRLPHERQHVICRPRQKQHSPNLQNTASSPSPRSSPREPFCSTNKTLDICLKLPSDRHHPSTTSCSAAGTRALQDSRREPVRWKC
jgi:hypothetical protein